MSQAMCNNPSVSLHGVIHNIRDMGKFVFLILRTGQGFVQCVYDKTGTEDERLILRHENAVAIHGEKRPAPRCAQGYEIYVHGVKVLSSPAADLPVNINKKITATQLDTDMALRPVSLRGERRREVFRLQAGIVRAFRQFLHENAFTEIFTPKIVSAGAEGGANIFKFDYFGKKAFLTQSPQFYKQMMVPVYERVFEIAPVFRAEKHDTARHLNEYIGVDFEMGFINGFHDIMNMETAMLQYAFSLLKEEYTPALSLLRLELPEIKAIPSIRFADAKERVCAKYGRKIKDPYDLEPEEERLIGELVKEEENSDFVFITHYPSKKRPFYAMDDPENPRYTLSFDLLYKGMEITTGGQRIHDYAAQMAKMRQKGLDPAQFESYLMLHKYGCPPHGGLGMGLERFCMQLLGESNIRKTSLFPRDTLRLNP